MLDSINVGDTGIVGLLGNTMDFLGLLVLRAMVTMMLTINKITKIKPSTISKIIFGSLVFSFGGLEVVAASVLTKAGSRGLDSGASMFWMRLLSIWLIESNKHSFEIAG